MPNPSPRFSLNSIDYQKIARFLAVQLVGFLLTLVPKAAGATYVYKGTDYTAIVVLVVNTASEAARRWLAGQPKPARPSRDVPTA